MAAELVAGVVDGLALAVRFNPIASLAGAVIAAALATRTERLRAAIAVVFVAWLLGDGVRIVPHVADAMQAAAEAGSGAVSVTWATIAVWAAGSVIAGYLVPVVSGSFVGRRVTVGTGWLAASAVAAATSAALAAAVARLAA